MSYLQKSLQGEVLNISKVDFDNLTDSEDLVVFVDYHMYRFASISRYSSGLYRVKLRCVEDTKLALLITLDYLHNNDVYLIKEVYMTCFDVYDVNINPDDSLFGSDTDIVVIHNKIELISIPSLTKQSNIDYGCKQIKLKG